MADRLRFGILGCGRIVERGFLPGLKQSSLSSSYAIASTRPGVAVEWAARHEVPQPYESYEELLADPKVDAVYIPCRGDMHHRWTLAAAAAGKHVLCEKPLACNMSEAAEMVEACRSAGVLLQEAFMWRHHPRSLRALELVQAGEIGELRLVVASFSFDIDRSDWRLHPEYGGGAMWDIGCYGVNAARFFTGDEPTETYARAHFSETGVDMTMQIALTFPDRVFANVDCSFEAPFRCHLEVVGEIGRLVLPTAFLPNLNGDLHIYRSVDQKAEPDIERFDGANQYSCQIDAFCESIRAGSLQDLGEDGFANMQAMEHIVSVARHEQ